MGGQEEDIVEGQRLLDRPHGIAFSQSSIIRERSFARERRRENQRQCHPLQGRSVDRKMNRLVVMLLAVAFAGTASAQLYKWVDNNGRVQYGDTPPGDASKVTRLRPPPAGSAPAPVAPAATSETAAKDKDKDKALTPEQAFKKRQQERQEAEQKAGKERAEADQKRAGCENAQAGLRQLQSGQRLSTVNSAGERVFIHDDERTRQLQRAQKSVDDWCK